LLELVVTVTVIGILAAVTVPGAAFVHGRATTSAAADDFALFLRCAQARARQRGESVRVVVDADGHGCHMDVQSGDEWSAVDRLGFGAASCTSAYPGRGVEFVSAGWPHVLSGGAGAGTFTFAWGGVTRRVVVQLGGYVRCP
jgi:type II secretory pathway pseudopilin PulG